MQTTTFVGYRYVDYVSKAGKPVKGYSVYFNETNENVIGVRSYDLWCSVETFSQFFATIPLGSEVCLSYNRYGGLVSCVVE